MSARRFFVGLVLSVFCLAPATPALGLANRVFVSQRSGNNANSCDNILTPCQTFAGAVPQLNPGGEAIVLDSGGYGPVTITQSVIIEAPTGVLAFIHPPSGDAITVNAPGATVVLRGLTIDGTGVTSSGIYVPSVSVLHVESCVIAGFAGSGKGIFFASAGELFVKDTVVRGNGNNGIFVAPSSGTARASLDHCRLEQNGSCGLDAYANASVTVRDSVTSGNTGRGMLAEFGGELNAEGCLVATNGIGLESDGGSSVLRASNCIVTDNGTGLTTTAGGALVSRSNNTVQGNGTKGSFTGFYLAD
jgi:hypothetical protein